jgi:hypothetical protein
MMAAAMILRFWCARHGSRARFARFAHTWTSELLALFASLAVSAAVAQTPSPAVTPPAATTPATAESLQALTGLVNTIVRENLPADFESRDNWGHTTDVWAGVDIRREGLQIKTKRRKKQVNDGTWKLIRVRLIEPETNLHLEVLDVRPLPAGRVEVDVAVDAKLAVFARLSQWELGVQLISLSANAQAQTQLRVRFELGLKLDPTKLPPDVILDPVVREAELRLVDFRLDRVSQVGGSLAHELGQQARDLLDREVAKQSAKLPDKINRQIGKNRERLRLSVQDLLTSQWGPLAAKQLGLSDPTSSGGTSPPP